ncbi:hypothetical protein MASR2M39_06530 [Ignavibacteriales bacterium]
MFKLNPFRFAPFSGLILLVLTMSTQVRAQFDTNSLSKAWYWPESIVYMGDQNGDSCDDFFVTEMDNAMGAGGKLSFFYGGNPVSAVPAFVIPNFSPKATTGCDESGWIPDIIVQRYGTRKPPVIDIYFGSGLDSPRLYIYISRQYFNLS